MSRIKKHLLIALFAMLFLTVASIPEDLYFNISFIEVVAFGIVIGFISFLVNKAK